MRLIVGLGNPGSQYEGTRHNVGFMVVRRLAGRHGLAGEKPKTRFHGATLEGSIASQRCLLLLPMTYMNLSGTAVTEAVAFYKLEPSELIVVVDDTALPLGRLRLRPDGSAGSHNGLADIERRLGTRQYPRLRVGVDHPTGRMAQRDWVLGRFTEPQLEVVRPAIERACDCVEAWLSQEMDGVMAAFNAGE